MTGRKPAFSYAKRELGLSLIELMVAMVLGLVIMGAVAGVMLSNSQGFRTTKALTQIQDSVRVGYELMARDIRQAGNMPCGNDIKVVNILKTAQNPNNPWQYEWGAGILGFAANDALSGVSNRVAGTEALVLTSGDAGDLYMAEYNVDNNSANFTVGNGSGGDHGLRDGDILLVCNEKQATIFQMSNGQGNDADKIVVNTGNNQDPGNCTKGLGEIILDDNDQCNVNGNRGPYDRNTVISKMASVAWYIGDNGRNTEGGRSLYMARLAPNSSGNAALNEVEIASGVVDMELLYRKQDTSGFVGAASVTDWGAINAVQISLKLDSQERNVSIDSSNNSGRISRELTSIVAIRNRSL